MPDKEKLKLLFICTGNSCRSQMAEAWTRKLWPDIFEVYSAGITAKGLDPLALKVIQEAGLDTLPLRSKNIDEFEDMEFDYVITVCDSAAANCPFFPAKTALLHAPFDDPPALAANAPSQEAALEIYRRVFNEVRDYVQGLPRRLGLVAGEDKSR